MNASKLKKIIFSAMVLGVISLLAFGCGETHDYEAVVTPPTCTQSGFTTYTCRICGDSYVGDVIDVTGHTVYFTRAVRATCFSRGRTSQSYCYVCKEVFDGSEELPRTEHYFVGEKCASCGYPIYESILDEYKLPEGLGKPEYTKAEIRKMIDDGLSLDEIRDKIGTYPDVVQYLYLRGFTYVYPDLSFTYDGISWAMNRAPGVVFDLREGNCGGMSNLINYILQGDYDSQGYVQMCGPNGSGHVFNYFLQDGTYYFVDFTVIMDNGRYSATDYTVYATKDIEKFAKASRNLPHFFTDIAVMIMYERDGYHLPVGTGKLNGKPVHCGIFSEEYRDELKILIKYDGFEMQYRALPPETAFPKGAL